MTRWQDGGERGTMTMHRREMLQGAAALTFLPAMAAAQGRVVTPAATAIEQAFHYAFPLYEFARIQQERAGAVGGQAGRLNMITHRAQLLDHNARQVTAPNNDTIYSSSFLDLSGGPVEIDAPSSTDRYFSIAFMQAFTDVFAYIGTRATDGRGGRHWIVGPRWDGTVPRGIRLIRAPTNDVWMLMRTLVNGPDDLAAASAFQQRLVLTMPPGRGAARGYATAARDVNDPENFLAVVNEVIARSPGGRDPLPRAARFAAQGIGVANAPSASLLAEYRAAIPTALANLRELFRFRDFSRDGWSYQPPNIADFGTNDRLRAAVALGGIAALGEAEAMYFHANFDAAGVPLSGARRYRWRLPPGGVPVDAFWSLTMYMVTPEGRYFFVENPINRFSIGDRTRGLVTRPDGSLDILIQREPAAGELAANWLPAPAGPLRLALRAYLPRRPLRDRLWRVPPLETL